MVQYDYEKKGRTVTGRLPYVRNTPGKQPDDHAGHLAGDRFGGSGQLDNLVSQYWLVNLSSYKVLENKMIFRRMWTMQKAYNDRYEETEQDRQDAERYAKMRQIPAEEKEEILRHITREVLENAPKMIAASGQKPEEYSPVTRECMAAMIYGMLMAMSIENLGYYEWRWTECMMAVVANAFFAMEEEQSAALAAYLFKSSNKKNQEYNVNIHQLVHIGIDAFYCLDRAEFLANGIQEVLNACYEDFGTGEEK